MSSPGCPVQLHVQFQIQTHELQGRDPCKFQPHAQPATPVRVQSQLHSHVPARSLSPSSAAREVIVPPGTAVFPPSQSQFQEVIAAPAIPSRLSDSSRCQAQFQIHTCNPAGPGRSRSDPPTATASVVFCASPVTATATPFVEPAVTATAAAFCWVTVPDAPGLSTRIETLVFCTPSCCAAAYSVPSAPPVLVDADTALI